MKLFVSQIYIEPGIKFPFSWIFQEWISEKLTEITHPSANFIQRYGVDFDLIFNMSAKAKLQVSEVRGPTVFKKTKDVEYTIFLPYDVIDKSEERVKCALNYLFKAIVSILQSFEIDTSVLEEKVPLFVEQICSDPTMFK